MKSFFKRNAIGLIVLGVAGATYAAPYHYNNAWTPHMNGGFIGVDALYLRPENGDLDYITVFPLTGGASFNTKAISTDYHWDWRLYGGIKFTCNDDLTLSWRRMRTSDNDSVSKFFPTPDSVVRFIGNNDWNRASAHINFDLDQFYAVWGHTIYFNNPWSVRYAAGIEYAKLDSDFTDNAEEFEYEIVQFTSNSHFRGWGPRVEFDMTYHLPCNFAFFADTNAALLVSTREVSLIADDDESSRFLNLDDAHFTTRHVIVPNFGARLGISYDYVFGQAGAEGCGSYTTLTVDAGWQVDSYIHAIERPDFSTFEFDSARTTLQSSSGFATTKTSNFGDQGLFLGIKVSSDWL